MSRNSAAARFCASPNSERGQKTLSAELRCRSCCPCPENRLPRRKLSKSSPMPRCSPPKATHRGRDGPNLPFARSSRNPSHRKRTRTYQLADAHGRLDHGDLGFYLRSQEPTYQLGGDGDARRHLVRARGIADCASADRGRVDLFLASARVRRKWPYSGRASAGD